MVYKKIQTSKGNYMDRNNVRYDVLEAHEAYTPQGKNVGWSVFESLGACLNAWGLVSAPLSETEAACESTAN